MFLDATPTITLDWSLVLAVIALVISVISALFTGWEVLVFRRMSELESKELDLHKSEFDLQKKELDLANERFLFKPSVKTRKRSNVDFKYTMKI